MKKLLYSLVTSVAILGLNVFPSQALESNLDQDIANQVESSQNEIQLATTSNNTYKYCFWIAMGIKVCF
ncbi:hypothetical protein Sta7437_1265 [Stanieria cyanosphaera PCC 7437]|uniref:Uncharacterized protein n=1 Tax=Stanieria cyanosphaera (strain ATCC 29371 / PCC 7437) TaxID=111780 RepID=K9XQD9_STAC7|nr:hypothetical protein [Stanieria cyanosphaera]AFZ34835.1 hypothetical protein Sta7437_1265 [Stanieria cyanosphaera PCC 7437]